MYKDSFRNFFSVETHPINLAIFRAVFFGMLLTQITWSRVLFYAGLPEELRFPPVGLGWLSPYLPMTPEYAVVGGYLYYLFAFTAMIGLFSRTSAFFVAILSFYVLGIERFFGDVSHNHHHIPVFSLILSLSYCGDALSIDAWRKNTLTAYAPSTVYTLPIRIVWLLYGVLYFFPGFWKLYSSGLEWAFSDNMKYQMYGKWFWTEWTPFFRIDQYPLLYKLSGLSTLFFETFFIFLIFFPVTRYLVVSLGIFFHVMTAIFLRVAFWSLISGYVVFFDWAKILRLSAEGKIRRGSVQPLLKGVSLAIICTNLFLGFSFIRFSWPLACYPTFDGMRGETRSTHGFVLLDRNSEEIDLERLSKSQSYGGKRIRSLLNKILAMTDQEKKREKLKAILPLWEKEQPKVKEVAAIQIYKFKNWVSPDRRHDNPISKTLVEEVRL